MGCYTFPSNFVYWEKVDEHQEIKEEYLPKIKNSSIDLPRKDSWLCNVINSAHHKELNNKIFDEYFIDKVIWKYFDKMLENRPYDFEVPKRSAIAGVWYNIYSEGQYQEAHDHYGSFMYTSEETTTVDLFSGIYLLELNEPNKTVFFQPAPTPVNKSLSGISYPTDHIEEGTVLFFPSGLLHYVLPVTKTRTTVSFNIISVFDNV